MSSLSKSWMSPLKISIFSFTVLCAALLLKYSLPAITEFAYSELPSIWTVVMTWLRPPYLYVVINGIIITIVASSKLQHHKVTVDLPHEILAVPPVPAPVVADFPPEYVASYEASPVKVQEYHLPDLEDKVMTTVLDPEMQDKTMMPVLNQYDVNVVNERISGDDVVVSRSMWMPERKSNEFSVPLYEKPPVSVRKPERKSDEFSVPLYEKPPASVRTGHRKAAKSVSEGGKALRVSKPKRQETLESTWKTITEGRPMPLTRHLRKSDTWETHNHHVPLDSEPKMTKSETFHDSSDRNVSTKASPMPGLGKLRKEPLGSWKLKKDPSLSQDDLNRRVEAFINKFNEDMRLQRQESLNQYMEMINRGAH